METYRELRGRQQKEFNAFPLHFAFGDDQIKKKFDELGLDPEKDLDKIIVIKGTGGFLLKKDGPAFEEMNKRHKKEFDDAIAGDKTGKGFIYQMFLYELTNYEYGYTGDDTDTLDALSYTHADIESNPLIKAGLEKAKQDIWNKN